MHNQKTQKTILGQHFSFLRLRDWNKILRSSVLRLRCPRLFLGSEEYPAFFNANYAKTTFAFTVSHSTREIRRTWKTDFVKCCTGLQLYDNKYKIQFIVLRNAQTRGIASEWRAKRKGLTLRPNNKLARRTAGQRIHWQCGKVGEWHTRRGRNQLAPGTGRKYLASKWHGLIITQDILVC